MMPTDPDHRRSAGFLAAQVSYFYAVRDVGVAIATLIALGLSAPVILTVTEAVAARTRPTARTLVSLTAALVGLALVSAFGVRARRPRRDR